VAEVIENQALEESAGLPGLCMGIMVAGLKVSSMRESVGRLGPVEDGEKMLLG